VTTLKLLPSPAFAPRGLFRPVRWLACAGLFLLLTSSVAWANLPNGGNGTGANVTLVNNGNGTITMQNGIVNALINIATAQIFTLTYNGTQVTTGGTAANDAFYWQGTSGSADTLVTIADPATNGGNYAEIDLEDPAANSGNAADAHRHFSMFRGSPGIYATEIMTRSASAAAGGASIPSLTSKLGSSPMNWLAQDANSPRFLAMPNVNDLATATSGVNFAPKEVTLLTTGNLAGQFDCKYDYAGDLGALTTTGWCSNTSNIGIWILHPSDEYFSSGPMHREILAQLMLLNTTFGGVHFGFNDDENFSAGETWSRVCGPFFIYLNKVAQGTANPPAALYADALAQAQAERGAWPYTWFTDGNYTQASGRGTVTGNIIINDYGNPNASPANLWVGVAQQPPSATSPLPADFQQFGKRYQYWVKTGANGNFSIPNVVAGSNYTLFAFGPGAIGQFQSQVLSGAIIPVTISYPATPFSVTVTGGNTTALGNLTWTPTRTGNTVWEIGVPDRDTQEFRHGDDFWHGDHGTAAVPAENWAPWENFSLDFPNGLTYAVGSSHWANDWDYAEPTILDPTTGNENAQTWTVTFTMPQGPVSNATACIYMGIAADFSGPVIVTVNNTNLGSTTGVTATPTGISSTGFFPYYSGAGCDAMIRMSSHGIFCDERITFPGSLLKAGANTVTLNMRKSGYFSNSALYDYVRLELSGYKPPAPGNLTALGGNGQVVLRWPAAPGAVSYNILRSTTSGSGYATIASNITGPVSGSTNDIATYTDSTAANGTPYYYVIQSVNSSGSSANSVQVSATPSSSAPSAPAAPTGVSATAGNQQVTLNWTASTGASYYLVSRSLTSGGPYVTVNSTVTGASYTDPARSNSMVYYYVVAAANPAGISANSTEVSAQPMPASAPSTPTSLTASAGADGITLTWAPITGATNYIVQRATSPSGPYTTLTTITATSFFADTTAAGNTTYYYTVTASNLAGFSGNSAILSLTSPPLAPATLGAVPGNTTVTLEWSASSGATSYIIMRGTSSGGETTLVTGISNTTYTNTGLTNNTTYYYVVEAVGPGGTSSSSPEASATPFAGGTGINWINTITASPQDWIVNSNWSNGVAFPNSVQAAAMVNSVITSNQTINLDQPITVGALSIGAANGSFTIAANTGSLTLDNTPGAASLQELATSSGDTISAPVAVNGGLIITNNSTTHALNLSGNLSGAASGITVNGNVTFNGTNTFSGGIFIDSNSTVFSGSIPASNATWGTGAITFMGGTLEFYGYGGSGGTDWGGCSNTFTVPAGQTGTLLLPPRFGYTTPFASALTGGGVLNVVVDYVRDYLTGNWSAFTGNINVSPRAGTGDFRINNTFGYANATINLGSGVNFYNLATNNQTIDVGELDGVVGVAIEAGSNAATNPTWRIGAKNTNSVFAGIISNSGVTALIKIGTGSLTLSGANTYTGTTTVSAGTLNVTGSIASSPTIQSGATLGGTGAIGGNLSVQTGGGLLLNSSGNLSISGNVTLSGNIVVTAATTLPVGNYTLLGYNGTLTGTPVFSYVPPTSASQAATFSTAIAHVITVIVFGPAAAPGNLSATPGNGNVTLNWTASTGATGYTIQRSTTNGSGYSTLATGVILTTYKDLTAANGTPYYYIVTATNAAGSSPNSTQASATPVAPPAAPTGLTATPGNTTVTLNWSAVSGAATYNVLLSSTSGSGYATVASALGNNTYTDSGLTNGSTYYYVVSATNAGGTSPNSAQVSAIPAQNLAQWTASYFPGVSDPNVIGPSADPDGDSLSNLVEYLLGTNPAVPDSAGAAMSSAADGDGNLVLTFRLSKNLTGVTYSVQQSTDLVNWTDTGVTPTVQSDQGAYTIMQAVVPLGSNAKLYLRLNVTSQ
jgi:rhamnogalacturonan endolyase